MLNGHSIIIVHGHDRSMCSLLRRHAYVLASSTGLTGDFRVIPAYECVRDEYVLAHTAAVVLGRVQGPQSAEFTEYYGRLKRKYGFRVVLDYDDCLWYPQPEYNTCPHNPETVAAFIGKVLRHVDLVTVSTEFLAIQWREKFGMDVPVQVIQNTLPRSMYGQRGRFITKPLEKPKVVYGGSPTHYCKGNPGDFAGPWVEWLNRGVEEDKFELHMFGWAERFNCWFLERVKDKIIMHDPVPACMWGQALRDTLGDIYIAPLQENDFNRAKSDLKLLEAGASGMALMGSVWHDFAPYNRAHPDSHVGPGYTVKDLDDMLSKLTQPQTFNDVQKEQNRILMHRWTEQGENMTAVLKAWAGPYLSAG